MNIKIIPYSAEYEESVERFNNRLDAANLDSYLYNSRFPTSSIPKWLPKEDGSDLYQECFLAVDDKYFVRGGYRLKHQPFYLYGNPVEIVTLQLPISEGIYNYDFALVGVHLYMDAVRRHPHLCALGGGGLNVPVGKFLISAGWQTMSIPFMFRIVNPNKFMVNAKFIRTSGLMRFLVDVARYSGMGWLGIKTIFALRCRYRKDSNIACEIVPEFSEWADHIWNMSRNEYSFIAVRDHDTLNRLYSVRDSRFIRIKVVKNDAVIGWAVVLNTLMSDHRHFGKMRVGTLVDCLSKAEDARDVAACAQSILEGGGSDLIISNQASRVWNQALRSLGFLEGPSNFPFFTSPKLSEILQPHGTRSGYFHINRGDGDGPIGL